MASSQTKIGDYLAWPVMTRWRTLGHMADVDRRRLGESRGREPTQRGEPSAEPVRPEDAAADGDHNDRTGDDDNNGTGGDGGWVPM